MAPVRASTREFEGFVPCMDWGGGGAQHLLVLGLSFDLSLHAS